MEDHRRFRLWIASYADWRPSHWNDVPPRATAIEIVDDVLYSATEAALFLHGFNGCMLADDQSIWAVALPVAVRYDGDAFPGMAVNGHAFAASLPAQSDADVISEKLPTSPIATQVTQLGLTDPV